MDKYQLFCYNSSEKGLYICPKGDIEHDVGEGLGEAKIVIRQLEDIRVTQYTAFLRFASAEKALAISADGRETECATSDELSDHTFVFDLDFENRTKAIRLVLWNHVAADIVLPIEFIEADKEAYYEKVATKKREDLLQKASFSVATGESLINVRFQPVSDAFAYAKVELRDNSKALLGRYKSEQDIFFVTIKDLAFGCYYLIIKEYDEKGEELISSDEISVHLS